MIPRNVDVVNAFLQQFRVRKITTAMSSIITTLVTRITLELQLGLLEFVHLGYKYNYNIF